MSADGRPGAPTRREAISYAGAMSTHDASHRDAADSSAPAPARAPAVPGHDATAQRNDELQAQVESLKAAALIRASIIEEQSARIADLEAHLRMLEEQLEARSHAAPRSDAERVYLGVRRRAGALVRRLAR
ncbi:hypothetical protein ACSL103130_10205 [Actinomyces slackii]|uniref:Uncharacterized protein n=1 Tax=Actinomyces slackii TaxID=52774 RepID=A0A3S4WIP5_9ACTO|nr:hypothetical protein [Actinomyces slackii]VEG75863.1 Uncharacterised protein [Actinomyces slackii]